MQPAAALTWSACRPQVRVLLVTKEEEVPQHTQLCWCYAADSDDDAELMHLDPPSQEPNAPALGHKVKLF